MDTEQSVVCANVFDALAVLVAIAREGAGWSRRGVRGWMFYKEIERVLKQADRRMPCTLNALSRRGYATCLAVRDFAGGRSYLYRTTERGARTLECTAGHVHVPPPSAGGDWGEDDRMLFMPLGAWAALAAMRDAVEEEVGQRRWGEHGWLTTAEMPRVLGITAWIDSSDLTWLMRRGLAERRPMLNPGRPVRPRLYWHVTSRGERAQVVDDFGIVSGLNTVVQVEVVPGSGPLQRRYARALADLLAQERENIKARCGILPPVPVPFIGEAGRYLSGRSSS